MASEQMRRRDNTSSEREVQVEKDKVPKITSQFESMTVHVTPLDSAAKDSSRDDQSVRSGNTVGDVGRGKAREAHEIESHHFESLKDSASGAADKGGRGGDRSEEEKDRQRESVADRARTANMVADKEAEEGRGGRQGREKSGPHMQSVGKFEVMRGAGEEEEEKGSKGREGGAAQGMMASEGSMQSGPDQGRGQSGPHHQAVGKVEVMRAGDEEKGGEGMRGRGTDYAMMAGKEDKSRDQERGRVGSSGSEQMRSKSEEGHRREHIRGSPTEMKMESNQSRNQNKELQQQQQKQQQQQNKQPSLEEVSKFRGEAQQNSMEALRAAEERYAKAKESAKQGLSSATEFYKDTLASAANNAADYTAPVAEKAKGAARTAVDYTAPVAEKAKGAARTAVDYTAPVAEKAKGAARTAVDYTAPVAVKAKGAAMTAVDYTAPVGVKAKGAARTAVDYTAPVAVKAKDVAVSAGKTTMHYAGDVAVDLKEKATVAGWTAAYYTTEVTVEGTKAAARAVMGVAEYAGHKAAEIAAVTGEKAEDYTFRKKEEAWREYQAKRSGDQRMGTEQSYGGGDQKEGMLKRDQDKSWSQTDENIFWDEDREGSREDRNVQREGGRPTDQSQRDEGEGAIGGGRNVEKQGTQAESDDQYMMMGKEGSQQGEVTGVLGAMGETLVEIAQTTKDMVIGHGEEEQQQQQQGKQGQQTKQYGN